MFILCIICMNTIIVSIVGRTNYVLRCTYKKLKQHGFFLIHKSFKCSLILSTRQHSESVFLKKNLIVCSISLTYRLIVNTYSVFVVAGRRAWRRRWGASAPPSCNGTSCTSNGSSRSPNNIRSRSVALYINHFFGKVINAVGLRWSLQLTGLVAALHYYLFRRFAQMPSQMDIRSSACALDLGNVGCPSIPEEKCPKRKFYYLI